MARQGDTLGERFVRTARRNWKKRCICDSLGTSFTYGQTFVGSIALADGVAKFSSGQEKVGVLLPSSTAAALANVAVTLSGKVPVNLSYVVSKELVLSAIDECNIKCVITSRLFLKKLPRLADLPGLVFLEDIGSKIGTAAGTKAYSAFRITRVIEILDILRIKTLTRNTVADEDQGIVIAKIDFTQQLRVGSEYRRCGDTPT